MGKFSEVINKVVSQVSKPAETKIDKAAKPKSEYKPQQRVDDSTRTAKEKPNKAKAFGDRLRQNKINSGKANSFDTGFQTGREIKMEKKRKTNFEEASKTDSGSNRPKKKRFGTDSASNIW